MNDIQPNDKVPLGSGQRPYMQVPKHAFIPLRVGLWKDSWSALVMGRADLAKDDVLLLDVVDLIALRGMPNFYLDTPTWEDSRRGYGYVGVGQLLNDVKDTWVVAALRIVARTAMDLEISWRAYVINMRPMETIKKGPPNWKDMPDRYYVDRWTGLPEGDDDRPTHTAAKALVHTVDYCFMQALSMHGVGKGDLRILSGSRFVG